MEISVKLPNNLYEDVSNIAGAKKKSVTEFVKMRIDKVSKLYNKLDKEFRETLK